MKKNNRFLGRIGMLALLTALLLMLPLAASANDTPDKADVLAWNGSYVRGTISDTNKVDYYKITLTEPGFLSVDARIYINYVHFEFYNEDLTTEYMGGSYGNATGSTVQPLAKSLSDYFEAGVYYVKFEKIGRHTGVYDIKCSFTAAENVESSADSNPATANTLKLNGNYKRGLISVQDDTDYWKITLSEPGLISVDVRVYFRYVNVEVFNEDLTKTYWGDYSIFGRPGSTTQPRLTSLSHYFEAGVYYVKIDKKGNDTGIYDIKCSFTAAKNVESDADNNPATANTLKLNDSYKRGLISMQDSEDYWKVTLPSPGNLVIDTRVYMHYMWFEFYNKDLTKRLMGSSYNYNGSMSEPGTQELSGHFEAGIYYVKIAKVSEYTGIYELKCSFTPDEGYTLMPNEPTVTPDPSSLTPTYDESLGKLTIPGSSTFEGFASFEGGLFYFTGGLQRTDYVGPVQVNGVFYAFDHGRLQTENMMMSFEGGLFAFSGGMLRTELTGLAAYNGERFVFDHGQYQHDACGPYLDPISGKWVYVNYGQYYPITDLVSYDGEVFYFVNGELASGFTGIVKDFKGTGLYIANGQHYKITDLVNNNGQVCYVVDGVFASDYTGVVTDFAGTQFNVVNGVVQ